VRRVASRLLLSPSRRRRLLAVTSSLARYVHRRSERGAARRLLQSMPEIVKRFSPPNRRR
jgi:hypothetical protein